MSSLNEAITALPTHEGVDLEAFRHIVDERLAELVPPQEGPAAAARHSLLAPGKRLRAILTMIACGEAGGEPDKALDCACAIEMIHTASLVFDDLPSMDNADLRRGLMTPHKKYGEDVAILAGIGLLNGAYDVVGNCSILDDSQKVSVMNIMAKSIGWSGLVAGQALDLASENGNAELIDIQDGKTGVLFEAALLSGAVAANALQEYEAAFRIYARGLGRAYQAFDDILDHVADDDLAGKTTDRDQGKSTAVSMAEGELDKAFIIAAAELKTAKDALPIGAAENSPLREFADLIIHYFDGKFRQSGLELNRSV